MKIKVTSKTIAVGILPLIVGYANASTKARILRGEDDGAAVAATSKKTKLPADLLAILEKNIAAGTVKETELPAGLLVLLEKQASIAAAGTTEKTDALPADVPLDQDDGIHAALTPTLSPSPTSYSKETLTVFPTDIPTTFYPTTLYPTLYPTASIAPTTACDDGMFVEVKIATDMFPEETTWTLQRNDREGVVVMSGGDYKKSFRIYKAGKCVPFGNYIFTIYDEYGDGLGIFSFLGFFQMGEYEVNINGVTTLSGGEDPFKYETRFIWNNKPSSKAGKASSKVGNSGGGYFLEGGDIVGLSMPYQSLSM